jgi:AraC family transcriptional regulator of arabinose operon
MVSKKRFRFGRFQQGTRYRTIRPRGSGDHLLIYTQAGAGQIVSGPKKVVVRPGDVILFRPGAPQDYGTDPETGKWDLVWAHFHPRPHWSSMLLWPRHPGEAPVLHLPASGDVRRNFSRAVRDMVTSSRRPGASALDFALNRLEEALLWACVAAGRDLLLEIDPRIRRGIEWLSTELAEPFRLDAAARRSGLSITRFSQLFKAATGKSPQQFSEEARLNHAAYLLNGSTLRVGEVATQCGYDNPLYFSRRFQRRFGRPPSAFRGDLG